MIELIGPPLNSFASSNLLMSRAYMCLVSSIFEGRLAALLEVSTSRLSYKLDMFLLRRALFSNVSKFHSLIDHKDFRNPVLHISRRQLF